MEKYEAIRNNRNELMEEIKRCYKNIFSTFGRISYHIYIFEDGEIETLQTVPGSSEGLVGRDRVLYHVIGISVSGFDPFDVTGEKEIDQLREFDEARLNSDYKSYLKDGGDEEDEDGFYEYIKENDKWFIDDFAENVADELVSSIDMNEIIDSILEEETAEF